MPSDPADYEKKHEFVPAAEIDSRVEKIQQYLQSRDLSGGFFIQNVDVYYLTGTLQRAIFFVPREGEPVLMVIKSIDRAKRESAIRTILPIKSRNDVLPLLSDMGHSRLNRVGLELDVLPAVQYFWFQKQLPSAEFVDVSPGIRAIRMIKSPYEVDQIRQATGILDRGYQYIATQIKEGMSELEIDGLLAWFARKEGHMGAMRIRAWNQEMPYAHVLSGESGAVLSYGETPGNGPGNTPAMPQGAGFRRVKRNESVYIDYGVAVNGYTSDQTRTLVIGKLDDTLLKAHDCSREILETLEKEVTPGMAWEYLYKRAREIADKKGFEKNFMGYRDGKVRFIGHGLGLEIDEFPIMAPGFGNRLEEGMVFALEPKFIFPGKAIVGIEDDYLVTSFGLERLTLTPQTVISVSESHSD